MSALHLTLASASPRRRDLLARLGVEPDAVTPADIDESPHKDERPRNYALRMGREKALAVEASGFVLAGDTVVAAGRRILPKTEDEAEARACLKLLSGRRHTVLSSVVLRAPDGTLRERLNENVVRFKISPMRRSLSISPAASGAARLADMQSRARPKASSSGSREAIQA